MRVPGPSGKGPIQGQTQVNKKSQPAAAEQPQRTRVSVSNLSQVLSSAREAETPDAQKVEKLRDSIRVGAFQVDRDRTAETMVHEEL